MFELLLHDLYKFKIQLETQKKKAENVINQENQMIISIIGAGGKTTLMYALTDAFSIKYRTLVTTTTHIYNPQECNGSYVTDIPGLMNRWDNQQYGVVGKEEKNGKLRALEMPELQSFLEQAEVVLVEADGAKRMPCKVSNTTEPVLLKETNVIIMVLGLDALGKRLRDVCFRCELAMDLLEVDRDHVMEEQDLIAIIKHQLEEQLEMSWESKEQFDEVRYYVVLNKCDNKKRKNQGEYIKKELEDEGKFKVYLTTFL